MDCEASREAISARLDGERGGLSLAELEGHLDLCIDCRRWQDRAHEVTRRFRLAAAQPVPSAERSLHVMRTASVTSRRWSRIALARAGLVAVAAAQTAVSAPALLLGSDRGAPIHLAHEMGSFDIALAAGFLVAAWRPSRARGMQALVGAAALMLVATALVDMATARTSAGEEAPHLLAVAGWLLLRRLASLMPAQQDAASALRWALPRARSPHLALTAGTSTGHDAAIGATDPAPAARTAEPMPVEHEIDREPLHAQKAAG